MQTKLGKVTLLFLLIGIGLFFNARNNPFHYDDHHSIQYNPHIRSLLNIPHFFSNPHTFSSQRTGFMFRPVLLISYALNYAWGGQEVQGYRWVNLVIHVGCTVLLYLLAVCLTGKEDLATGIGLVFLVHPAHGELINYISSRSDLLAAIASECGADVYLSGVAGRDYLDFEPFNEGGIEVSFQEFRHPTYDQGYSTFEPNMGVQDALFNLGGQGVLEMLEKAGT